MTNISTKLIYIDYKDLIANYKKPEFWGKKWTIYDYGNIKVELAINSISCFNNQIAMGMDVYYKGNKKRRYSRHVAGYIGSYYNDYYTGVFMVPINHPEYTNEIFKNKIYGKVKDLIDSIEGTLITDFPNYRAESDRIDNLERMWNSQAEDWLDEKGVEDDTVRDAYISAYISACRARTSDCRKLILEANSDKVLTKEKLLFASFSNKKEDVEKYNKILKTQKVSKSSIRTWLQSQKDKEIEWKDLLGAIK